MKKATRNIAVYSEDGKTRIGALSCGDAVRVLEENADGVLIAYVTGRVASGDAAYLVDEAEWKGAVSARDKLAAFAAAQVGCLYVLGAQGQKMTPALIKKLEHVSDTDYKRALAQYEAHVKSGATLVAYDCSGLVVAHLLAAGLIGGDRNANGLYFSECDAIGKDELAAGDLVFRKYATQNRMYHVGVYMGDGTVVHAKGRDDGVVREAIGKVAWNRCGRLKCFGEAAYTRALRNAGKPYMSGADVRAVQQALAAAGFDPGGIDGSYGPKTEAAVRAYQQAHGLEVDGIVGPKTWAALMG